MKSTKTFNNISDKLKAKIPKLKPGEIVVFQMLHGTPNPEPDEKERSRSPILYGKRQVLTNFRVYDEFQLDENKKEVGGFADVGCVDGWIGDIPSKYRCFVPGQGQQSQFQGKFQLVGGNIKDEELYEVLYISPEREGSPCPDSSIEILFKIVDIKADSKNTMTKVGRLRKALDLAKDIPMPKARQIMAALNKPTYQDDEVLKAKIQELATDEYELFIKTYEDTKTPVLADIKEALDGGIITHDLATGVVKIGNIELTNLKVQDPNAVVSTIVNWVETSQNGADVLANIQKQLTSKETLTN